MPDLDGTGPQGRGPMTGRGFGYCLLRESRERPGQMEGFAGIDGVPFAHTNQGEAEQEKEVVQMPLGNATGPSGMGPMTGRGGGFGARFPAPGDGNPSGAQGCMFPFGMRPVGPYGGASYGYPTGYAARYVGWFGRWVRGGFGLARRFGRGRGWRGGRGRFGPRW